MELTWPPAIGTGADAGPPPQPATIDADTAPRVSGEHPPGRSPLRRSPPAERTRGRVVGVDLGIKSLAVLSTGEIVPNPRHLDDALVALRRTQRKVSRRMNLARLADEVTSKASCARTEKSPLETHVRPP